jgi:predicted porin
MKRSLILAAAATLASGGAFAQSSLSLYGLLDGSFGKSIFADATGERATLHSGGDNGSSEGNSTTRFGLKGSTDVGSGVKANFNLQSSGITSNGAVNGAFFNRQAWFGLSGGFGEFRLGKQDTVAFQTMIDFDFNGLSNGVSSGAYTNVSATGAGTVNRPGRLDRQFQYISPSFSGITAQVGLRPKAGVRVAGDKDSLGLGLKYAGGPVAVAVAYQSKLSSDPTTGPAKDFVSLAGSYDFGVAKVMLSYADGGKFVDGGSGKGFQLGAQAPVAGATIGFLYAKNSDKDFAKPKSLELFANKEIFKNVIAYGEYGDLKADAPVATYFGAAGTDTKAKGYALGLIYVF